MDISRDVKMTEPVEARGVLARGHGVAAWRQIADDIEAEIAGGRWAAGSQLPTEAILARRFGVNRHTVRRAFAALSSRGLVRATQGRGTFVEARPLVYPIGRRTRFSEIVSQAGREAWGDLVSSREREVDEALAETFGLPKGGLVLELTTVHRADGTPISTARIALPLPRFASFDAAYAETGSLTRAYAAFGVADYLRLSTRIIARAAEPDEAAMLDLAPGRVLLVVDSVNANPAGRPIQATRSHFAADRVEFVIET